MSDPQDLTRMLLDARDGDPRAEAKVVELLYADLHRQAVRMMRRESASHTLQATALVHEAYARLAGSQTPEWKDRNHFLAVASTVMRRVLVDHARARDSAKRGGPEKPLSLDVGLPLSVEHDPDVIALDRALDRLAELDPRQAKVVTLRFFGGMTVAEVAEVLDVSKRTVEAEWTMAKAWLRQQMTQG